MRTGLDRLRALEDVVARLRSERIGLLAHPASVDARFVHAEAVLRGLGVRPVVLFGPEHGFSGHAQDMIGVSDRERDGARIVSLYGEREEDLSPTREDLAGLDTLVVDLSDVGSRYYTYVWTAVLAVRACRDAGVRVLVLDRPNPLGTTEIEGRLQQPGFLSFVGLERLPIRHALTLGQIVAGRAALEGCGEIVEVVRTGADDGDPPPWVMPSPNMPTPETALVYPGGCLLEGTNLSEGRGTTRPFELVGAPWLDGERLARALNDSPLEGFRARPTGFEPTFQKHARTLCGGVQIHVTDRAAFRPVRVYTALVALAHGQHPDAFRFRTERYEFIDHLPAFDLLTGSSHARERILGGDDPFAVAEWVALVGDEEREVVASYRAGAAHVSHR